ncbi:MAG: hypothetical protein IT336_10980 [Thermomicrobiales bacterium]|nr:hypothetical protein [Thermomicrobiales bacterium]
MNSRDVLRGKYQESLRVIGAWLDIRGFSDVRIVEDNGEFVVEASRAGGHESPATERFRLDGESIDRLCRAARNDRGSALSRYPLHPLPTAG